jgi:hypothetical protein
MLMSSLPDVQTAVAAREALEGHCIYEGGFCKLHLSYSRHTDLSVKVLYKSGVQAAQKKGLWANRKPC